jgi:hypothetical protein
VSEDLRERAAEALRDYRTAIVRQAYAVGDAKRPEDVGDSNERARVAHDAILALLSEPAEVVDVLKVEGWLSEPDHNGVRYLYPEPTELCEPVIVGTHPYGSPALLSAPEPATEANCRGSRVLGTACGKCPRCRESAPELDEVADAPDPAVRVPEIGFAAHVNMVAEGTASAHGFIATWLPWLSVPVPTAAEPERDALEEAIDWAVFELRPDDSDDGLRRDDWLGILLNVLNDDANREHWDALAAPDPDAFMMMLTELGLLRDGLREVVKLRLRTLATPEARAPAWDTDKYPGVEEER